LNEHKTGGQFVRRRILVSVDNIGKNPRVCVSLIDIFRQKGHKLGGRARILDERNPGYSEKLARLRRKEGEGFPVRSRIEVEVVSIAEIMAPGYWLFPDTTTEDTQIDQSLKAYGVRRYGRRRWRCCFASAGTRDRIKYKSAT
jgi:predicted pyridoxine 5'-phosphate oxidase superfamily flavin-nucleotide-binding protein